MINIFFYCVFIQQMFCMVVVVVGCPVTTLVISNMGTFLEVTTALDLI